MNVGGLQLLLVLTALFILAAMAVSWWRTRDPLHPTLYLGILCLAGYVADPWRQVVHPDLWMYYPDAGDLVLPLVVQGVGVAALLAGTLTRLRPLSSFGPQQDPLRYLRGIPPGRLLKLVIVMAVLAAFSYWYAIANVGGFYAAYSRHKGGGWTPFGWVNELQLLSYPAIILWALYCRLSGRTALLGYLLPALVIAHPVLFQATFGGRRGPMFLTLASLIFGWLLTRRRAPSIFLVGFLFGVALLAVVFIQSQRRHLYLGSGEGVQLEEFADVLAQDEIGPGDNFIVSAAFVIVATEHDYFDWGRELVTNFVVRPIPKQVWPEKYVDSSEILYPERPRLWLENPIFSAQFGWQPPNGSAINAVVDVYRMFSVFFLVPLFFLGGWFARTWYGFRSEKATQTTDYILMGMLSIYLVSQNLEAFLVRLVFMMVVYRGVMYLVGLRRLSGRFGSSNMISSRRATAPL